MGNDQTQDKMEIFHGAMIQHGQLSCRIYLMKIDRADPLFLIQKLKALAEQNGYTKIFAKIPVNYNDIFLTAGFEIEAQVPGLYNGELDGVFSGYFLDDNRKIEENATELDQILELSKSKSGNGVNTGEIRQNAVIRKCEPKDVERMAEIYREVFPSYPFPIDEPNYILETMRSHVVYFGVEVDGKLVALSSSEMDVTAQNVEMTDFATMPDHRGHGYAIHLLAQMEIEMQHREIKTAFTIARAVSPGMNITFSKMGYTYGGRLKNNTNISGQMESMNIWYKPMAQSM
jgi:putative beta-lysine N-acetyltransferase